MHRFGRITILEVEVAFKERKNVDPSTQEASVKEVFSLSMPVIVSMASMSMLGLVDTYFMKWVNTEAQAAVGLGAPTIFSVLSLCFGLFSGLTTFVSQYFGAKRHADCGFMLWQMLFLAVVLGIISAFIFPSIVLKLLDLMNTNPAILEPTFEYMKVRLYATPWVFIGFTLLSFLRGIGDMKTPAIVSLIVVAVNIPLTYIFAFGAGPIPAYGVVGAAIGTIISQAIEMICYAVVVYNKNNNGRFKTRRFSPPSLKAYQHITKIALPVGITWAIEQYGWLFFGLFISSLPKEASAANSIVMGFMNLVFMPGLAISIATTTLVGKYMGAGNIRSAEKSANYCIVLSISFLVILGFITVALRDFIAHGFSDDQSVIDIAKNLFLFGLVYQIFDATGLTTSGALRGAGDTRFPMIVGFISIWAIMLPLTYFCGQYLGWGVYGAWAASVACIMVSGTVYFIRFKLGKWKSMKVA